MDRSIGQCPVPLDGAKWNRYGRAATIQSDRRRRANSRWDGPESKDCRRNVWPEVLHHVRRFGMDYDAIRDQGGLVQQNEHAHCVARLRQTEWQTGRVHLGIWL